MPCEYSEKIAIFGSAFNPPTLGHLSVLERLTHFDRILLLPSYHHAWGKSMAAFEQRCEWVNDFLNDLTLKHAQLCDMEKDLKTDGPVTTWQVLNHLQSKYPDAHLTFVIGPDNLLNFHKFHQSDAILKRWDILSCAETVNIRSTQIRENLSRGEDISHLTTQSLAAKLSYSDFE